jgi:hypothetical protein
MVFIYHVYASSDQLTACLRDLARLFKKDPIIAVCFLDIQKKGRAFDPIDCVN